MRRTSNACVKPLKKSVRKPSHLQAPKNTVCSQETAERIVGRRSTTRPKPPFTKCRRLSTGLVGLFTRKSSASTRNRRCPIDGDDQGGDWASVVINRTIPSIARSARLLVQPGFIPFPEAKMAGKVEVSRLRVEMKGHEHSVERIVKRLLPRLPEIHSIGKTLSVGCLDDSHLWGKLVSGARH